VNLFCVGRVSAQQKPLIYREANITANVAPPSHNEDIANRKEDNYSAEVLIPPPPQYVQEIYKYNDIVISLNKARKRVINPLKTGINALVGISERTFTR